MDTIRAKNGYKVCRFKRPLYGFLFGNFTEDECVHLRAVMDGDRLIMIACLVPMDDYLQEREQNEMFHFCERFTTQKGYHYIYWRDEETDTDYITKEGSL